MHHNETYGIMKNNNRLMVLMLITSTMLLFQNCKNSTTPQNAATSLEQIKEADQQNDYTRILHLADSLGATGELKEGASYYWQGYAYYRMKQRHTAEFYWREAIEATRESSDEDDLEVYAKSASYLTGLHIRHLNFTSALNIVKPALKKLDQEKYNTSSDYTNLLIFAGCCKGYFNPEDSVANQLFEKAYQRHLDHIKVTPSHEAYSNAIVGFINIAYGWITVKKYSKGLVWTQRLGKLIEEYRKLYPDNNAYTDKQWARYIIFSAIALEGLGDKAEANKAFERYQKTLFSKTLEGQSDASDYLMMAGHWQEAAQNLSALDKLFATEQVGQSLEDIQKKMLKKYRANYLAGFRDSANAVANQICQRLDSAIIKAQWVDADEQETIRQKEEEILQQQERISKGRLMALVTTFIVFNISFAIYTIIRHRAQRRLAAANAQLEQRNQQLQIANARAEESARMKTNFIQQISHEIRTPLNILSGFTQIVTSTDMELDEDTKKDISHQIIENTDRITGLVNKMLELSDANSVSVIECTDQVSVIQIASQAVDASGITQTPHLLFDLQVAPEAENTMLKTNQIAATRALTLLLDNAQKFTHSAEAKGNEVLSDKQAKAILRITQAHKYVRFVVEDTGIGVPPEEAEHIFEEFVQLDEYYNGTGIGLTVARSLVRRMGGEITLDTSYKTGARFVMELPIA